MLGIFFIDRKYYINRPSNYNNNGKFFSKFSPSIYDSSKKCFVCGRTSCWFIKHIKEKRQKSRNKFVKRFIDFINKRYNSYFQKYEKKKNNIIEDLKTLILNMKENLEKTENFITITIIFTSNQTINLYSKFFNQVIYYIFTKSNNFLIITRYDFTQF